jgi:hypothetical protein
MFLLPRSILAQRHSAAVSIQRVARGRISRTQKVTSEIEVLSACRIQCCIRGMLYRTSDRYVLTQLYLQLPPFWRTILLANPVNSEVYCHDENFDPISSVKNLISEKQQRSRVSNILLNIPASGSLDPNKEEMGVSIAKVQALRIAVRGLNHISTSILPSAPEMQWRATGRARMSHQIPQSFDLQPYYSLRKGQNVSIKGRVEYKDRDSIMLFDPHIDNIQMGWSEGRAASLCEQCFKGLRMIHCETCRQV